MSESIRRRQTVARHGQLRSPGAVSQLLKLIGIALAVVFVSGAAVVAYIATDLAGTVSANAVELDGQESIPPDIGAYEGGFNILLVGVDTCEDEYAHLFGERCSGKDSHGTLNDVNLLVHVSAEPRRVTAISFPRDLMIPIPSCEDADGNTYSAMSKQPLNSSWGYGELNCVARTISELSGQNIDFAAAVTFGGVIEITDAIGGVDVCVASHITDRHTALDLPPGTHNLKGYDALQFLRTRKGVGDGSDLGRIGNQQQYMSNLAKKMLSGEVLGNIPTMLRLATVAVDNLTPSESLADPMRLVQIGLAVKDTDLQDVVFLQYPTAADPDNSAKVVPLHSAADEMWAAIAANQRLTVTHENGSNEGVIVQDDGAGDEQQHTPDATDAPTTTEAIELPSTIKGNSAAQTTCSNGKQRG